MPTSPQSVLYPGSLEPCHLELAPTQRPLEPIHSHCLGSFSGSSMELTLPERDPP